MARRLSALLSVSLCVLAVGMLFGAGIYGPMAPTDLTATEMPSGIRLHWVGSPSGGIAGYNLYRSLVSTIADPATRLNQAPIQGTEFSDAGVGRGAFYCYTVRAVTAGGRESQDSNEACASFRPNAFGRFKRGDANADGTLDISDPILTLSHLFLGTFQPQCLDAVDFDDSGRIDLGDATASLSFQFLGGEPPPAPGARSCGLDPTPEDVELGCNFHLCENLGT